MIIRLARLTLARGDFVYILQQFHVQAMMDVVQPNAIQGMIMIVNILVGVEGVVVVALILVYH
jgi:hypothetical protein